MTLSIITINYNNLKGLKDTFSSVINQTTHDFEYIVIDGASTDGSVEYIKENASIITQWISEPDKGVYDAMNKGAKIATGEYIIYVNSGDKLCVQNTIQSLLNLSFNSDIYFGSVKNRKENGNYYIWTPPRETQLSLQYLRWNVLHHPGAIINRELQLKYPYDTSLKICSDRKFFIETLILGNASYKTIPILINEFAPSGISGAHAAKEMFKEDELILKDLFTERQLRDIYQSNWLTQQISKPMTQYYGKTKILCKFIALLMRLLHMN